MNHVLNHRIFRGLIQLAVRLREGKRNITWISDIPLRLGHLGVFLLCLGTWCGSSLVFFFSLGRWAFFSFPCLCARILTPEKPQTLALFLPSIIHGALSVWMADVGLTTLSVVVVILRKEPQGT